MTAFQRLIDAAQAQGLNMQDRGDTVLIQCPAHNDGRPSLSVRRIEGSVLLYCFAGCDTKDVATALGLKLSDLFDDQRGYVYSYPGGRQVLRTPNKKFIQQGNKQDTSLYGVDRLKDLGPVYVCFAPDTEVLTPSGWIPLPELPADARVAQYDYGRVEFVEPVARQQFRYDGDMVHIHSKWSDALVTVDHRMLTKWWGQDEVTVHAEEIAKGRLLPVAGIAEGGGHITSDDARLIAAWQADGVNCTRGYRVAWNLKKPRKIARLKEILDACGIAWKEQSFPSTPGWVYITVDRRDHWGLDSGWKTLPWEMLNWPQRARHAFIEELGGWDGDFSGKNGIRYFTSDHQSAEVVSAMAAITGYGSILRADSRPGRTDGYVVNLARKQWRMLGSNPKRVPYDGMVYCLTVPSSYLVTRRNGKVLIAGNCEGEKDVLAIQAAGGQAVTAPNGASADPARYDWSPLRGRVVRVVADLDKPGRERAARVAEFLESVAMSVGIYEPIVGKDAADHIAAGKALAEFRCLSAPDVLSFSEALDEWREWRDSPHIKPIKTPWGSLNNKIAGGLHPGRLYVVGARTGSGKSVAGVNMATYAASQGRAALVVSVEMPRVEILSRVISAEAHVPYDNITRREFDDHLVKIDQWIATHRSLPLFICDKPSLSIEEVAAKCRMLKETNDLALAFIDYAQLIKPSSSSVSRQEQVAHIVRSSKVLAMELAIPVILAAQLNRNADDEVNGAPRLPAMKDLRESGELEQSADVIMLLHRTTVNDQIYVVIPKNRTGRTAQVTLREKFDEARIEAV